MCGIVGVWNINDHKVDMNALQTMTRTLVHRGPDDEGLWSSGGVGFGHRRLSIIDPQGSPQPMTVANATICFNGEIFNYKELRAQLVSAGHNFSFAGDTEVILAQFLNHGQEGIKALNGQFAFALFDAGKKELWLYRDRLGVMPLYYCFDGEKLIFGSEIKALLPALGKSPEIDEQSLKEYFAYRSVPVPNTFFKGIKKLSPGHWLRLDASGDLKTGAYWSLPTEASDEGISEQEALELLSDGLNEAVSSRLVADVPVGAFLSGGVDSSLIVALMSELSGKSGVETYSAGFDAPDSDELPFARVVADQYGTKHHEVTVPPTELQSLWPKLTWHRDGPMSEPADVAVYRLAQTARQNVKVLLSGEGADELFAGYAKYRQWTNAANLDFLPTPLRAKIVKPLSPFMRYRVAMAMCVERGPDRMREWRTSFPSDELDEIFGAENRHDYRQIWHDSSGDELQKMLYYDCHTWLVDNLLERGDRMAMAASVEFRPPFLDHRLVELAFKLPSRYKLNGKVTKWLVKAVARRKLPASIVDRRKVGFRVPLDKWFRDELKDYTHDLLLSSNSYVLGTVGRKRLEKVLADHQAGRLNEESRIWTMLSLELWHSVYFGDLASEYKTT